MSVVNNRSDHERAFEFQEPTIISVIPVFALSYGCFECTLNRNRQNLERSRNADPQDLGHNTMMLGINCVKGTRRTYSQTYSKA
jgi:hypothetical protein